MKCSATGFCGEEKDKCSATGFCGEEKDKCSATGEGASKINDKGQLIIKNKYKRDTKRVQ